MGKSFNNDIKISDDEETTTKKVMKCITDRSRARKDDPGHPDNCEVAFKYYQVFADAETVETVFVSCTYKAPAKPYSLEMFFLKIKIHGIAIARYTPNAAR